MRPNYLLFPRNDFKYTTDRLKIKEWQNIYHEKSKHKKNFKEKNTIEEEGEHFIMIKKICLSRIHEILHVHTFNNRDKPQLQLWI